MRSGKQFLFSVQKFMLQAENKGESYDVQAFLLVGLRFTNACKQISLGLPEKPWEPVNGRSSVQI